jgi:uncharacterized protein with FMN-binding domain
MKRFLLIAAGTVGGLGAVLSITPPQLSASTVGQGLDLGTLPNSNTSTQTPVVSQSTSATVAPAATTKPSAKPTKSSTPTNTPSNTTSVPATASATPTQSAAPTVVSTPTVTPTPTKTATPAPTHTATAVPAPTKTATPTPTVKSVSGTFTGPVVNVNYGNVQVEITVSNGKITDARALQAPSGRNDRYTNYALPLLKQQTLAAQSTNIQGASGASYTTYGWRKSLQGAMAKAGL